MPSSHSPSSSQEPMYSIAAQPPASKARSRRLPPPCWSDNETVALIDVYREKWYSLRRGNLRAPDWQEVADGVAAQCRLGNPPKTATQCRHKMEKLRKRYRAEIQRIGNTPKGHRYLSSWVHFKLMDSMELGSPNSDVNPSSQDDEEEDENEDDLMLYPKGVKQAISLPPNRRYQGSIATAVGDRNRYRNGAKIPNFAEPSAMYRNNRSFEDYPPPMNPQYGSGKSSRNGYSKEAFGGENRIHGSVQGMKRKEEDIEKNDRKNVMDEMVAAILKLGDGFVKMERMKMDMARELESMRMKTEIKQTEIILETQQKLWDSFSKTVMEKNKKMKRMPTPES